MRMIFNWNRSQKPEYQESIPVGCALPAGWLEGGAVRKVGGTFQGVGGAVEEVGVLSRGVGAVWGMVLSRGVERCAVHNRKWYHNPPTNRMTDRQVQKHYLAPNLVKTPENLALWLSVSSFYLFRLKWHGYKHLQPHSCLEDSNYTCNGHSHT